jgi:hypothetical protein
MQRHMMHKILHANDEFDPDQWFERVATGEQMTQNAADPSVSDQTLAAWN